MRMLKNELYLQQMKNKEMNKSFEDEKINQMNDHKNG